MIEGIFLNSGPSAALGRGPPHEKPKSEGTLLVSPFDSIPTMDRGARILTCDHMELWQVVSNLKLQVVDAMGEASEEY